MNIIRCVFLVLLTVILLPVNANDKKNDKPYVIQPVTAGLGIGLGTGVVVGHTCVVYRRSGDEGVWRTTE